MSQPKGAARSDYARALTVEPAPRIQRAYLFTLDPTPSQTQALLSHAGASRVAYNTLLRMVSQNLDQRAAEKSYDIPADDLTPSIGWSTFSLQAHWNLVRDDVAPWWGENAAQSYRYGAAQLAKALDNFAKSKNGTRKGPKMGFPKYKSRRGRLSVGFEDRARLDSSRHHVTLPRIGRVHLHESTRELGMLLEQGKAKINSSTVSYARGRWHVSFQVETVNTYVRPLRKASAPLTVVGIDLGVKDLIVIADADGCELERIPAPKHLAAAAGKLRSLQKKASRQVSPYDNTTRRTQTASAGWRRTQAQIVKSHARVANLRQDHIHQVTTRLAKKYDVIGVEHLNVSGMLAKAKPKPAPNRPGVYLRNNRAAKRGLSKSISDAAFGEILRQLDYKTTWYGASLHRVDRFFPSSKTCSSCGTVKAKLSLRVRVFDCTDCGLKIDRDLNAAINIAKAATCAVLKPASPAAPVEGSSIVSGRDRGKSKSAKAQAAPVDEATIPPETRELPARKDRTKLDPDGTVSTETGPT
jgi:putative transposase